MRAASAAGFRYAVLTTRHHDAYFLGDSRFGDWHAGHYVGRDLIAPWVQACRDHGLKVGFYFSGPDWYHGREYQNYAFPEEKKPPYYNWKHEKVDSLPPMPDALKSQVRTIAHGQVEEGVGVRDMERGRLAEIQPRPWQTDTSISDWFYNQRWKTKDTGTMYRSARWVIHFLADGVSKNGNLLLNIVQRPDGALDPEVEQLLQELARWMKVNGEAIHGTRPWRIFGEGPVQSDTDAPRSRQEDFAFSGRDLRFTQSKDGGTVHAIALGRPAGRELSIRALGRTAGLPASTIERVEILGHPQPVAFNRADEALHVGLPDLLGDPPAVVFKITGHHLAAGARTP